MTNRITKVTIRDGRLTPTEAEVYVSAELNAVFSSTQLRGRLIGPTCPYAATVEIAYPLRESSREYASTGFPHITTRAIIPEPNWWHPEAPYLYRGPLELWQANECAERVELTHGLRVIRLGPAGFKVNGTVLSLRGIARDRLTADEARHWHDAGCNVLLTDVGNVGEELWELADRYGFLVLGRITKRSDRARANPVVRKYASYLGWLLDQELSDDELVRAVLPSPAWDRQELGVELRRAPVAPLPRQIGFVACDEKLLPELSELPVPRIVLSRRPFETADSAAPDVLGTIFTDV